MRGPAAPPHQGIYRVPPPPPGQPGSVFKILHTRQSEIILEFPRENSSNPFLNCRSCFRNVRRFNYHFGFVVEEIIELGHPKISMFRKKFVF